MPINAYLRTVEKEFSAQFANNLDVYQSTANSSTPNGNVSGDLILAFTSVIIGAVTLFFVILAFRRDRLRNGKPKDIESRVYFEDPLLKVKIAARNVGLAPIKLELVDRTVHLTTEIGDVFPLELTRESKSNSISKKGREQFTYHAKKLAQEPVKKGCEARGIKPYLLKIKITDAIGNEELIEHTGYLDYHEDRDIG